MKKIIYLNIVILCVFLVNISLAEKTPKRKVNFDGNISVKRIEVKSEQKPGTIEYKTILTVTSTNNINYPKLVQGSIIFFDAKLDEKSNELAVVYYTGRNLACSYYKLQDGKWILLKRFDMFYYWGLCIEVKLVDMHTIEMTLEGQSTKNKKGVIKTYPITINDNYEIEKINGKKIDDSLAKPHYLLNYVSTEGLIALKNYTYILYNRLKEKAKKRELTEEEKEMLNIFE